MLTTTLKTRRLRMRGEGKVDVNNNTEDQEIKDER